IRVQRTVAAGAEVEVAPLLPPGRYRMRMQGETRYGYLDIGAGAAAEIAWRASAEPAEHAAAMAPTVRRVTDSSVDRMSALEASKPIHDRSAGARAETRIRLRISLNTRPCIAVKLNTGNDYFGNTVNVAAKLQALAESFRIAMSHAVNSAPGVAPWLAEEGAP